ncbi:MAG TPA: hypothetical protein VGN52_19485 [Burkholderiales bacterium]|jgi:hypothetical protein
MIGNLISNVLVRKPGETAAPLPAGAAPTVEPEAAAVQPPAAPVQAPAAEVGARDEFYRRKEYERGQAELWLRAQRLLRSLRTDPDWADPKRLERFGAKVYSQNDEDGILAEIFRRIGVRHKTFVEFGVGDGLENNTAWLLAQGWRGLWMDGGDENAKMISYGFQPLIERGVLQFRQAFITRDNVDELIAGAGLGAEIDLLSIDVDGNDLYLWEAINCISPRVVSIEYNAKFPPPAAWRIAYNPTHTWKGDDYMGASLGAIQRVAQAKGYRLAGCNLAGVNCFYVREDLAYGHFAEPASPEHLYQPARYDLIYAYRGGHGATSLSIIQGASEALGLAIDVPKVDATYTPDVP